jgi:hypothetical protein
MLNWSVSGFLHWSLNGEMVFFGQKPALQGRKLASEHKISDHSK